MPALILLLATLQLNDAGIGEIGITARAGGDLTVCRAAGEAMLHEATLLPGSYASYACHDPAGQAGVLGVVAYVKPTTRSIRIVEGAKATMEDCKATAQKAIETKVVPGPMSWACFNLSDF